jgi:hypothetical protein
VAGRFERQVLAALRPGDSERYELDPGRARTLARSLRQAAEGPDGPAELERAVALVVALEGHLESPSAAERLRSLLEADGAAKAVLTERFAPDAARPRPRNPATPLQAPLHGSPGPAVLRFGQRGPGRR